MTSLSDILLPWDHTEQPNDLFLTFRNSDDCIVHVPIATSNVNSLRSSSDSVILSELNKQMDARLVSKAQEYGPLLLPGSIFYVGSNPRPRRKVNLYHESYEISYGQRGNYGENLHTTENTVISNGGFNDLVELEKLSSTFTDRRIGMNLSQTDVANSLGKLYGVHRSVSMISRFERMDLSLSNYLKVYPIILRWLKDSETADGRDKIIRAVVDFQNNNNSNNNNDTKSPVKESPQAESPVFSKFPKRRPRTILPDSTRRELERIYRQNKKLSAHELIELAKELNVDKKIIKVWFYNRHTRSIIDRKRRLKRAKRKC
ncbi:unnamed protein product [Schistosoma curassoni]|uniref:POU domain protein n=1 Tax=Schistosoma curassoni TaxID=6186 RepID=A0A183KPR6_9TREM|nr:unnamed protein product [Schistosoma curassoni]VDP62744.1 unnamed protein product [Schistosoma curassoni]